MGRQILMVFFSKPRHVVAAHADESKPIITVPLIILAVLAIFGGMLNLPGLPKVPALSVHTLTGWLEHTLAGVEAGEFNLLVAGLATGLALLAFFLAWILYGRKALVEGQKDPLKRLLGPLFTVFERKYWVDEGYGALFINRFVDAGHFLADIIDGRFWHDWFHEKVIAGTYNWLSRTVLNLRIDTQGIDAFFNGLGELTKRISAGLRRLQNGFVRSYALAVLFGVVIIVGFLLLK